MFFFVAIYMLVIQALRSDLWAHIVSIDATEVVEAVHLLARFAIIFVALTLFTVLYIIGLSRYSTEGEGRKAANRIADELGLLKNRQMSFQYLLLQFLLIGGAVYLLELGVLFAESIRPLLQSFALEGGVAWQTFCMFALACGFVLVWNASLHLLAQYASAVGLRCGSYGPEKSKGKRDSTLESAGA